MTIEDLDIYVFRMEREKSKWKIICEKSGRELDINVDLCGRIGFNWEIILTSDFFHVYPQNPLWFFLDAHGQKQ